MDAYAVSKHVGYPPRKVRQLADLVRGQKVDSALTTLRFTKRAASEAVSKTIQSAMHNLVNKHGSTVAAEDMFVKAIIIEEGATMYRIRPRAQGRAYRIRKRSSHIRGWVTLMEEKASMKKSASTSKPATTTKTASPSKKAAAARGAKQWDRRPTQSASGSGSTARGIPAGSRPRNTRSGSTRTSRSAITSRSACSRPVSRASKSSARAARRRSTFIPVSYTHLRAHETPEHL